MQTQNTPFDFIPMHTDWNSFFEMQQEMPYWLHLTQKVSHKYQKERCFPPPPDVFNAFKLCSLNDLKVVILGQDPYHGLGQAHGLSFSVPDFITLPPSLRNIFKEKMADVGGNEPFHGNLSNWANQGVLLLNQILTVTDGHAGSHVNLGWEEFSMQLINYITKEKDFVVFMLWGAHAQKNIKFIDSQKHAIIKTAHPSPLSANRGGWFGEKPFSKANEFLIQKGLTSIVW